MISLLARFALGAWENYCQAVKKTGEMMKVVLIGLGMVSKTHLAAIKDAGFTLLGVMGRSFAKAEVRARDLTQDFGTPVRAFSDIAAVTRCAPDFVIVTTPPDARLDIVTALAKAEIPILMEKPVERTLTAASKIIEICTRADIPLGIVFQHRVRAASIALKTILNDAGLGQISWVKIDVPWWRDQSYYDAPGRGSYARDGGGVMISQAIHTLDLALWLLGPIARISAVMGKTPLHDLEAEDYASAQFEMANGTLGTLTATTADFPGGAESITIQGTQAHAHIEAGVLTVQHLDGRVETYGEVATTGGGADPMAFTHDWHQTILEDFAMAIGDGRAPIAPGHSALVVHRVIDAMERSAREQTWTEV